MSAPIEFISAGAGSGKTYRMTTCLYDELKAGVIAEKIIATTFTKKAANELVERVRQRLMTEREYALAIGVGEALIGTVNSVCGQLLTQLAFAAGLPPVLDVIDEQPAAFLFSQALEGAVESDEVSTMNRLAARLGQEDWKKSIHVLVNQARANTIAASALWEQAERSITELMVFFPDPVERDFNLELQSVLREVLADITSNGDSTKGTADYAGVLQDALRNLERDELSWGSWVKLSKAKATSRSDHAAQRVRDLALNYDRHPGLRADIGDWIRRVYAIASRAMQSYQAFKKERGLIDFIDQEELLLGLLDDPQVMTLLDGEIDLLLVDEFQDTSPIQLALFVRLAAIAKKAVWVGDVKQAIYGFRGCDPALMSAVVKTIQQKGHKIETLDTSRRSRPQLVHFANALFVPAFSGQLTAEQVQLKPHRTEVIHDNALAFWWLAGSNKTLRSGALASGVAELFSSGRMVVDRNRQQPRALRFRDLAILCRTNTNAAEYATALAAIGLPVSLGRPGLLSTPEARLTLACLRRMVDAGDTLASAEILTLSDAMAPEDWLQERIAYLGNGGISARWRLEGDNVHPALAALEQLRPQLSVLSPAEVLEAVILLGEVERAAVSWGPSPFAAAQRLTNLESLRAMARNYEDSCRRTRSAATVPGLLFWLADLHSEGLDNREEDDTTDAIHVLTHHRAKGLEWPVVICADLDFGIRPRIWECNALSQTPAVDIADPLAGRRLRYWPWPFAKQSAGIAVNDKISASPTGQEDLIKQTWEAKRLLYVSITRARDLLILPFNTESRQKRAWLDCLQADWLQGVNGELHLPNGHKIQCREQNFESGATRFEDEGSPNIGWFPRRQDPNPKLPAAIIPSSTVAVPASIGSTLHLSEPLVLSGSPEMATIGTVVHNIFGAYLCGGLETDALKRVSTLLEQQNLAKHLDAADLLQRAERFKLTLTNEFGATQFHPEWPIAGVMNTRQRLNGWIDLLVDTPGGWILIDHKTFPGNQGGWADQALKYSGQLAVYRDAVTKATGRPVLSQWIHFCLGGEMLEVVL